MCDRRNKFCYICGLLVDIDHRRDFRNNGGVVEIYNKLFNRSYKFSRWYEPEFICDYCCRTLKKPSVTLHFSTPMIWHHQLYHKPDDCYFCQTNTKGYSFKTRKSVKYANVLTVTKPIYVSDEVPTTSKAAIEIEKDLEDEEYLPPKYSSMERHLISNADFCDLIRDIHLSKRQCEILGSRLKQWNLVDQDFRVTTCRRSDHTVSIEESFKTDENDCNLVYCGDVPKLFSALNQNYKADEWRLFIDGSCKSMFNPKKVFISVL